MTVEVCRQRGKLYLAVIFRRGNGRAKRYYYLIYRSDTGERVTGSPDEYRSLRACKQAARVWTDTTPVE